MEKYLWVIGNVAPRNFFNSTLEASLGLLPVRSCVREMVSCWYYAVCYAVLRCVLRCVLLLCARRTNGRAKIRQGVQLAGGRLALLDALGGSNGHEVVAKGRSWTH